MKRDKKPPVYPLDVHEWLIWIVINIRTNEKVILQIRNSKYNNEIDLIKRELEFMCYALWGSISFLEYISVSKYT